MDDARFLSQTQAKPVLQLRETSENKFEVVTTGLTLLDQYPDFDSRCNTQSRAGDGESLGLSSSEFGYSAGRPPVVVCDDRPSGAAWSVWRTVKPSGACPP